MLGGLHLIDMELFDQYLKVFSVNVLSEHLVMTVLCINVCECCRRTSILIQAAVSKRIRVTVLKKVTCI